MNETNQPDTDITTREVSSVKRADFDGAGLGLFSELEAIELARVAQAGGKKLFVRLSPPLRLALRARLTAGGQTGAAGHCKSARTFDA
jgi:hypothetical protein